MTINKPKTERHLFELGESSLCRLVISSWDKPGNKTIWLEIINQDEELDGGVIRRGERMWLGTNGVNDLYKKLKEVLGE